MKNSTARAPKCAARKCATPDSAPPARPESERPASESTASESTTTVAANRDPSLDPSLDPRVEDRLESLGISSIEEGDVLVFLYRHPSSLTSADRIARPLGYPGAMAGDALDTLESQNVIRCSGPFQGVGLYQVSLDDGQEVSKGNRPHGGLGHLISLIEDRAGRLLLEGAILEKRLVETNQELKRSIQELEDVNVSLKAKVAELDQSNVEKEVLLREVHHRVNNNLQVIASLLHMQTETFPDDPLADVLRVSRHRVESMALIHAELYDSADLRDVEFARYAARLASNLLLSYGMDEGRIRLRVEMGPLRMGVDQAIPLGLILSELISNALKHAFPDGRTGAIAIEGGRRGDRIELVVRDDGVGIAEASAPRQRKSLGLQIVNILCRQLKATLQQPRGEGASFHISFPDKASGRASVAETGRG